MQPQRQLRVPSYRRHKASGQAVVTIAGKDVYLGRYGTAASKAEYDRVIAEWLAAGRPTATPQRTGAGGTDVTITELVLRYLKHCESYYRDNDGRPGKEAFNMKATMRLLRRLYGSTLAAEFGPIQLKAVRNAMIELGLARPTVNQRIGRVKRMFRWAVGEGIVPPMVLHGLNAVAGLRAGRSEAKETAPVRPVPDAFVDAIKPYVSRQIWAMVELQRLTGARSGEIVIMRTADLDMSGKVWLYRPARHKTAHHGHERVIAIGPRAQAVLRPWLRTELEAYLFQPREADAERRAALSAARKTPLSCGNRPGTNRRHRPKKKPRDHYDPQSYGAAIRRACEAAGIPNWHPHQLRHNAATALRKEFGLEVARVVLGHRSAAITEVYAELDLAKAIEAMERVG